MTEEGAVSTLQLLHVPLNPAERHHRILGHERNSMIVLGLNICPFAIISRIRPGGRATRSRERGFGLIFQCSDGLSGSGGINIIIEDLFWIFDAELSCLILLEEA